MKTHNLTQSSLRNDPINFWMHGFSFRILEDEIEVQGVISSLSRSKSDFKCSSDAEMHQECNELEWYSNWCLDSSNFLKIQGRVLPSRRTVYLKGEIGHDRPMKRRIAINGRDEASVDRIIAIKSDPSDQRSRVEVSPRVLIWNVASLDHPLDFNPTIAMCR